MAINLPIVSKFDDSGLKKAEGALGGLSSTLKTLGGVLAAAFSIKAITSFAKESVLAAEAVATADARIAQIAKSMDLFGQDTDKVTKRLTDYAKANELLLATDENVIKATQAKLLTFKELAGSADEAGGAFDRATIAAVDLAAAGFGSAETNAVQLGKALQDPIKGITALARSGVTFTEAEKEKIKALTESGQILEAQNMILAAIETQVGGTAAATANASDQMNLAFGNIKETVGAALMPAFAALAAAMIPVAQEIAPVLGEAVGALTPVLAEVAGALPGLINAFMPIIPVLMQVIGVVIELAKAVIPVLIEVLNVLVPVIASLLPIFLDLIKQAIVPIIPLFANLISAIAPLIGAILPVLVSLFSQLLPPLVTLLNALLIPLIPIIVAVVNAFLPLLEMILPLLIDIINNFLVPYLTTLANILSFVLVQALGTLTAGMRSFSDFMTGFSTAFKNVWQGISNFVKGIINGILGFIQTMINGVIDGVNAVVRALNNIKVEIPEWVPLLGGQKFSLNLPTLQKINIPKLADGGIVMPTPGGVLANIAEAGKPEAVIPLDRFGDMGKTVNYNITVNAGMGSDGSDIGRQIVDQILRYERSSGRVFARA
jgi:phage-related protein